MSLDYRTGMATLLAIPILYAGISEGSDMLPSKYDSSNSSHEDYIYSWEEEISKLPYKLNEKEKLLQKVSILHRVVSLMLMEAEEIPPDIATIINKRFWDLV